MSPRPGARVLKMGSSCCDGFFGAADHHAVAALQAPDAAAGADIDVMNSFVLEHLRAANVVFEIGIAAVDEDVAGFHLLRLRLARLLRWVAPAGTMSQAMRGDAELAGRSRRAKRRGRRLRRPCP